MTDIAVQVFDGVLGKELTLPLVDGNDAVENHPSRYSYVVPNPYGADTPLPPTGLPTSSTLLVFELTVIFDNVLGVNVTLQQVDAIFATQNFQARFSWVSGAPVPPPPPLEIDMYLGQFTVALLPVAPPIWSTATATNGRKIGEGAGLGTGTPVYFQGIWRTFSSDQPVQS